MLRRGYFAHGNFGARFHDFGARARFLGENLAWGSGSYGSAAHVRRMWGPRPRPRPPTPPPPLPPGRPRPAGGSVRRAAVGHGRDRGLRRALTATARPRRAHLPSDGVAPRASRRAA